MGIARFLLVGGGTPAGAVPSAWPGRGSLEGRSNADGSWSAWRLLGGNNRELGRSALVYPDTGATLEAIDVLRARFGELVATHQTDERGLWRWRLTLDEEPVVVSSRAYLRQRESHYSLAQFIAVAPGAEGPRRRPAPAPPAPASAPEPAPEGRGSAAAAPLQRSRRTPVPAPTGRAVVVPRPVAAPFPRRSVPGAVWAR